MHSLSTLTTLSLVLLTVLNPSSAAPATPAACVIAKDTDVSKCLSSTNIVIQGPFTVPPETKLDLSGLKDGTSVTVKDTITWAKSSKFTKSDFLFTLGGNKITFDGTGATFHGNGQLYWDTKGANGVDNKPKFFKVLTTGGSLIKGIKIKNSPVHIFSIGGSDTTLDHITVDNTDGNKLSGGKTLGHNTDAFDVSATGITIQYSTVQNQDDCLAINDGGNIKFLHNTCSGGAVHGISIGSIASGKKVDGVTVTSCTISDSDNGVRIKTISGATGGYVKNVNYTDITLSNINKYGIVIEQDYLNGGPTGTPTGGIPISGVTLNGVRGTVSSSAKYSTYILCAACSGFSFSNINITPKNSNCTGVPKTLTGC